MAGIGMYGVYYAKATVVDGVVTGYTGGVKTMGKAISAAFEPNNPDINALYANDGIAESDTSAASGGTLTLVLDRLAQEAAVDLYNLATDTVTVEVNGEQAEGKRIKYTGLEVSSPVGVAFIRTHQENSVRSCEVVLYRRGTFNMPGTNAQTKGESIEWQTPEITGTIIGLEGDGTNAWFESIRFDTLAAAIAYIEDYFKESVGV